jgi:hypothetical protein
MNNYSRDVAVVNVGYTEINNDSSTWSVINVGNNDNHPPPVLGIVDVGDNDNCLPSEDGNSSQVGQILWANSDSAINNEPHDAAVCQLKCTSP